jgi:hypothetical protein
MWKFVGLALLGLITAAPTHAAEYTCDDPQVVEALKAGLVCPSGYCLVGLSFEQLKTKSESEIRAFLLRLKDNNGWYSGFREEFYGILSRGAVAAVSMITSVTAHQTDYKPAIKRYACEAQLSIDNGKLNDYLPYTYLINLSAAKDPSAAEAMLRIRKATEGAPSNSAPLRRHLNTKVQEDLKQGRTLNGLAQVRYSVEPGSNGPVLNIVRSYLAQRELQAPGVAR